MRTHEKTLWILCQPVSPASSTTMRLNSVEARNALHTCGPNASVLATASAATVECREPNARQRPVATSTSGIMRPNCGL